MTHEDQGRPLETGRSGRSVMKLLLATAACLLAVGLYNPVPAQNANSTQTSPLATQPLPAQGPGQAATGAAMTGSAPVPGTSSTIDNSQQQQGVLLKPGQAADDMNAASGAPNATQGQQKN